MYIFFWQAEVAKVVETQTGLERQLELIETHQREVCVSSKFLYVSFPLIDRSFILHSMVLFLSLLFQASAVFIYYAKDLASLNYAPHCYMHISSLTYVPQILFFCYCCLSCG